MPDVSTLTTVVPEPSAPLGVLPALAAERFGDTPFLSDLPWSSYEPAVRTFADFAIAVDDFADRLWAAGIRHGDVVAVVQRNHIEVEAVMCALGKIGALPALLSSAMEPGELLECLARLERPHLVVDAHGAERLAGAHAAVSLLTTQAIALTPTDQSWARQALDRELHVAKPRQADERFVITHSSGTTGIPKLAAHSTRSLFGMVAPMIMIFKSQYNGSDLNAKHLSFVHARTCAGTLASFEAGMPMLSVSDPEPANLKRVMREYGPTSLETHPNVFIHWESLAEDPERPLGGVQRFISTFDAMHRRTVRRLFAATDVPGAHYLQAYGQTESGPICLRIVTRADVDSYSPRNVGHTGAGIEMRVVDPGGTPVVAGTVGAIETRSAGRMRGYVGGPAPMADDAWWPMGDIGRLLEDGSLELLDREVDHVQGMDSLLAAEDRLLEELPELVELVIVKTEADRLVAVACARPGSSGDPMRFHEAAQRLGLGELPVRFWDWEALPLTGSYKVRRGVLRQRLSRPLGTAPADLSGR